MKYIALMTRSPRCWPSVMAQLFGVSPRVTAIIMHQGQAPFIHPSLSLPRHGFILQIKLLTMPGAPGTDYWCWWVWRVAPSLGTALHTWPRHHKARGRTIHPQIQITLRRRRGNSVVSSNKGHWAGTKACQLKQFSTRLWWDEFLSICNFVNLLNEASPSLSPDPAQTRKPRC